MRPGRDRATPGRTNTQTICGLAFAAEGRGCRPGETLRMADIEKPTWRQERREAAPDLGLGLLLEIDHDVAAEDRMQRPLHRPGANEDELAKGDELAQLTAGAALLPALSGSGGKPALPQGRWQ